MLFAGSDGCCIRLITSHVLRRKNSFAFLAVSSASFASSSCSMSSRADSIASVVGRRRERMAKHLRFGAPPGMQYCIESLAAGE